MDGQTEPLRFPGDTLEQMDFPDAARKEAGVELHKVQIPAEKPLAASQAAAAISTAIRPTAG